VTPNRAKARLREGGIVIGTMISEMRTEEISYVLAAAGFDFFVLDTEHGTASMETVQRLCRSGRSAGIAPLVRVTGISYPLIARTLDAGALGLMVPRVDSGAEARQIVRSAKFPPDGERGFGLRAAITDYSGASVPQTIAWSNAETMLMAQVESRQCLDHLDEIAATPGIDVLLIGPNDLSISLGVPGEHMHPVMQEAYRHVATTAARHGIAAGIHPGDLAVAEYGRSVGMRCLMIASEVRLLLGAARQAVKALRVDPGHTR
jgi:2-keto-3-deoxy-L-rhamnonate aldolase RhmA